MPDYSEFYKTKEKEDYSEFYKQPATSSVMEHIRSKLPYQKEVAGFLGRAENQALPLAQKGLEKWREADYPITPEMTKTSGSKFYGMSETERYMANIGRQAHALPRFPLDVAQQVLMKGEGGVRAPQEAGIQAVKTGAEFVRFIPETIGDYMIYISPLSSAEQRREAVERIATGPLNIFFVAGIVKGGVRGAKRLGILVKRARKQKGLPVEEPPAKEVPTITEEQIAKQAPKKEVLGEPEMEMGKELKRRGVTEKPMPAFKLGDEIITDPTGQAMLHPDIPLTKAQHRRITLASKDPAGWVYRGKFYGRDAKDFIWSKEYWAKPKGVTEKPAVKEPLEGKPGVMGGVEAKGQEVSVQNVMNALKEVKPLRGEQEAIYTKERGASLARSLAIRKKTTGEAGYYAELGQFEGEMPKVAFESLRKKVSQTDIDNLFNKVRDSEFLTEFEKLSARKGLVKMFGEHGGRVPTEGELILLEQVFPPEFIKTVMAKRPLWAKIKEAGWQLANIPRSAMASYDLSFGLRQGAFAAPTFRAEFYRAWKKQFGWFGSEKVYQAARQALVKDPDFMFAKRSKLDFTDVGQIMIRREERFMSAWAEKLPVVGRGIRASSRAYTMFSNKYRFDIFKSMVRDAERMGFQPRKDPLLARRMADLANMSTGRGSLGAFEKVAVPLNAFFFSPRLNIARLKLLNPALYIRRNKYTRKKALKMALGASGTAVTMLTLAKLMGAEAGLNPLSADFGKIKIRNTRIDLLAGFGQFIRAGAQIIMKKTISTTTGKVTVLGEGYKPRTRLDVALQQIEYKESPVASFATTLLKGRDFAGKPVSVPKEVGRRFVPMVVADIVELAKEDPKLLPLGVLPFFGMGMQTYAHFYDKMARIEKREGRSPAWYKAKQKLTNSGFKYNPKKYAEYYRGLK